MIATTIAGQTFLLAQKFRVIVADKGRGVVLKISDKIVNGITANKFYLGVQKIPFVS